MQTSISKYFSGKTINSTATPIRPTKAQEVVIDLCEPNVEPAVPQDEQNEEANSINMDFELNQTKHSKFVSTIVKSFDAPSSVASFQQSTSDAKTSKLTPLELQVLEVRKAFPDALLIVECGYRMRFFGDDAVAAAKVLSIYAHMDHNFMVASIPTFRTVVHCRRLVAAGYKVAVVRQTETAALRKAGKGPIAKGAPKKVAPASNSATFARAVAGVFSPGTSVEEYDPAFRDLVQSSNAASSAMDDFGDGDEERESLESGDEEPVQGGSAEEDEPEASAEVWITSVYEEATNPGGSSGGNYYVNRVIAVASVDVRAHKVQCVSFGGELAETEFMQYLDLLKPTEVIYSDNLADGLVRLLSDLLFTGQNSSAEPLTASTRFLRRLAPLPLIEYITSSLLGGSLKVGEVKGATSSCMDLTGRGEDDHEWLASPRIDPECRCAVYGLSSYLQSMNLGQALCHPEVEVVGGTANQPLIAAAAAEGVKDSSADVADSFKLDAVTARDLEVFQCAAGTNVLESNTHGGAQSNKVSKGKRAGIGASSAGRPLSLFDILNHCKSTYGRRTLRQWLLHPLCRREPLCARQSAVRWLAACTQHGVKAGASSGCAWVHNVLGIFSSFADLESLLTSLQHARIFPRRLARLLSCTTAIAAVVDPSQGCYAGGVADMPGALKTALSQIDFRQLGVITRIFASKIVNEAVVADAVTNVFCLEAERDFPSLSGFREEMARTEAQLAAELINIRVLLKIPALEYKSLRTGPVSSIEHLVEVPVAMASRVPADWVRSNCTKQMERYHSPRVLALQDQLYQLRDEIKRAAREAWTQFVQQVREALCAPLRSVLVVLGEVDALLSLSKLCGLPGYVEPVFSDSNSINIEISEGRHPMVEKYLEQVGDQFISNDVNLSCDFADRSCQIVTGPNMGGKSSYVRMIALICLMAQVGAHVPAQLAHLCLFDRIFTRMGAGDDLAAGQSTFMSELHRTNHILQRATRRSLVVLDELGRGTATNDGLAIAQATLTYLMRTVGCATLFVTHFPQIADLVERAKSTGSSSTDLTAGADSVVLSFPPGRAVNIHMDYLEHAAAQNHLPEVMFLYRAVEGASRGSYGLNVARLAGIPQRVLALAAKNSAWMRARRTGELSNDTFESKKRKAEEPLESNAKHIAT